MFHVTRHTLIILGAYFLLFPLFGCGGIIHQASNPQEDSTPLFESDPIPYVVDIRVEGEENSDLRSSMEKHSQLVLLKDHPPDSMLGLIRRARADEQSAVNLLHSLGYYDGTASAHVTEADNQGGQARVTLMLLPGSRYHMGTVNLSYHPAPTPLPPFPGICPSSPPGKISNLDHDQPAVADNVLAAVNKIPEDLHRSGYPEAIVASTRYTLNKAEKTLNATAVVDPGPAAVMGHAVIRGTKKVNPEYLARLVKWQQGEPWDARRLQAYRSELQRLGLFRFVDVKPAPAEQGTPLEGKDCLNLPVLVDVRESSFRTVSASIRYATDTGIGLQGEWQHRNLFGAGEKLMLKAPFAQNKRGVQTDFEKPAFGRPDQKFLAGSSYIREDTDAYNTTAFNAYAGVERKISSFWWGSLKIFGEEGSVTRVTRDEYRYASLIFTLRRDTRNNIINPQQGTSLQLDAAPTTGYYKGDFSGISTKFTASGYYAPFDDDFLIFAARTSVGSFLGVSMINIPPSLRFYCGGGGSVRGYSYQAIGSKDSYGEPKGGRSFHDINLEARFRVTENVGIVPFIDGGMVYAGETPHLFQDFQWGAGIGLRYYTPIGPVRLDIAVPLNKRSDDRGYQIYISIGQSF